MPRPEKLPPSKTVEQEKTDLTLFVSEMFEGETILIKRYSQIITYLVNELAITRLELRDWILEAVNENPK